MDDNSVRLTRSSGAGGRSSWSATDAERDREHPRSILIADPDLAQDPGLLHYTDARAALETFGLVHEQKNGVHLTSHVRWQKLRKKLRCGPWVVAPITMAAAPADPAGGGNFGVAALSTRTTTAEVRFCHRPPGSLWHFPPCSPISTANRHLGQNGETRTPGGARSRCSPDCPESCERENTVPSHGPRPLC